MMNYFQKKKLAFMSIVNRIKGFIRTVSGVLPLTLEGCVDEESIIDYTLYGQSVQDGTPAPDTPIEVESVGEKSRNLFDIDSYGEYKDSQGYEYIDISNLKIGTKYTISSNEKLVFKINTSVGSSVNANGGTQATLVTNFTFTFTEIYKSIGRLYIITTKTWVSETKENLMSQNIQLTESDTVLPYEPYGYKIPIKVSGKNLFDIDKVTNSWGVVEYNGVQCLKYTDTSQSNQGAFKYTDNFKENTRYTFAVKIYDEGVNKNTMLNFVYTDGSEYSLQIAKMGVVYKYTTSANKTLKYIIAGHAWGISRYMDLTVTQLEKGTTATDYEPYHEPITTNIYLDEPLRKVGDYADYIKSVDLKTGKGTAVRYVGVNKLLANSDISFAKAVTGSSAMNRYFYTPKPGIKSAQTSKGVGYCTVLRKDYEVWNTWTKPQIYFSMANNSIGIVIPIDIEHSYSAIYNYLSNNGENEVVIYYQVATPTETPITLPTIPTFKGTSIISADTTVQPSNVEIEYYSTEKE